jgi:hypothetical protein
MRSLKKITPNKERAKALYEMALQTEKMLSETKYEYSAIILKEYYNLIRELITAIMYFDGFKVLGDGKHIKTVYYLEKIGFLKDEIIFVDQLRDIRNRIYYEGVNIDAELLKRKEPSIKSIIEKLKTSMKNRICL